MEEIKTNIINEENDLKEKLLNWRKELVFKLENKENQKMNIFIIRKDIIDKNEGSFVNAHIAEEKSLQISIKEKNSSQRKYKKLDFFILNEECWNCLFGEKYNKLEYAYEGYFLNKILLLIKDSNCFFLYLNEKQEIIKGFCKISNEINDIRNIIIDYFRENEPAKKDEFFNKYGIKYQILEVNSIFENKKDKEEIKFNNYIEQNDNVSKINSFKGNTDNNNIDKYRENLSVFQNVQFQNEGKNFPNPNICSQKEGTKINEPNQKSNNQKIYIHKKYKGGNNNIKAIPNSYNTKKVKEKQSEKENTKINVDFKNLKDIFDPKTKIIKRNRNPSAQNKNNFTSNKILKNKENKNEIIDTFLPKRSLHRLHIPGVIGLNKIGDIPFVNATIQCFSNIPRFKSELIEKEKYAILEKNKSNNKKFSFALAEVLKNLWENLTSRVYEPKNFIKIINETNKYIAQLSILPLNFIEFLIKEIHNELRNLKVEKNQNINFLSNKNFYEMFINYKKNYENYNNSIVTKEFNGYCIDIKRCFRCNNWTANVNDIHHFLFLNFPLEQIKYFSNYNPNYINIYACFEYYQREEPFTLNCNCGLQMVKSRKLLSLSKTLIINFEYKENIVKVIYEEFLNLKKYVKLNSSPFYYELIGVICYINSGNEKNYIAYCKNENCKWYKYNDSKVTNISFSEIEGLPYVLFFSYIQL